jgi:hypothetical protein
MDLVYVPSLTFCAAFLTCLGRDFGCHAYHGHVPGRDHHVCVYDYLSRGLYVVRQSGRDVMA